MYLHYTLKLEVCQYAQHFFAKNLFQCYTYMHNYLKGRLVMSTFRNLDEAKKFFAKDLFATENGITLDEIGEGTACASVVLNDGHKNAQGGVMGGVIFTLADLAFAAASNNLHCPSVSQQVSINFLSGARGDKLFARARCIKDGSSTGVYAVMVTDSLGNEVALFTGTAFKK